MGWKCEYCKRKGHQVINTRTYGEGTNTELPIIEITESVSRELHKYRQHQGKEQAGVLVASMVEDNYVRINGASPSMVATQSYNGCVRDADAANKYIQEQYERSEHTKVYVGEWHTHPELTPIPSSVDIDSIKKIYNRGGLAIPFVVLVIIGRRNDYVAIYRDAEIIEIKPI